MPHLSREVGFLPRISAALVSMCARSGAGVDQLVGPEIRRLLEGDQASGRRDLVVGHAVEGPFIAAKKETRQPVTEFRQYPFTVRSCFSLATGNQALAVWRQINSAFSKVFHAISFSIRCATPAG